MLSTLLSNLPDIINYWTGLVLSWGIFSGLALDRLMRFSDRFGRGRRVSDQYLYAVVWICNILMFMFLFLVSGYAPGIADAIIVFNVFMTVLLGYVSIGIAKWWKTCFMDTTEYDHFLKSKFLS